MDRGEISGSFFLLEHHMLKYGIILRQKSIMNNHKASIFDRRFFHA
uniref:Uncharacterized protein n=1 Tax=Siphoviridae sp. ctEJG5 TaxID=2827814 RepID=A0A8S5RXP3_9CAUD|nr:MAG TPA: hypothetical protein [Siphoviridae sp. ctEJG5]